ncbi:hypothetical protein ACQ4LE_000645 [Meloidogyne hapla]
MIFKSLLLFFVWFGVILNLVNSMHLPTQPPQEIEMSSAVETTIPEETASAANQNDPPRNNKVSKGLYAMSALLRTSIFAFNRK